MRLAAPDSRQSCIASKVGKSFAGAWPREDEAVVAFENETARVYLKGRSFTNTSRLSIKHTAHPNSNSRVIQRSCAAAAFLVRRFKFDENYYTSRRDKNSIRHTLHAWASPF